MNAVYPYQKSPRCKATSKRTRKPCMAPAVKGWKVCRFHGAGGGAPKGERNGRYRHGLYCQTAIAERQIVRELMRDCTEFAHNARQGISWGVSQGQRNSVRQKSVNDFLRHVWTVWEPTLQDATRAAAQKTETVLQREVSHGQVDIEQGSQTFGPVGCPRTVEANSQLNSENRGGHRG